MGLHSAIAVGQGRLRRHRARHRFLCPDCLRFAAVRYACAGCRHPLPETLAATKGLYVRDCPHCDTPHFPNRTSTLAAYCPHCHGQGEPAHRHGHRVRVVATLLPQDYLRLCRSADVPDARRDEGFTWIVSPQTILVIVNLSSFAIPDPLPEDHLLCHLDALWMSGIESDALALAQAADRLFQHLGEKAFVRKKLPLYVNQRECDPAVRNMLSVRFRQITFNPNSTDTSDFTADMATLLETGPMLGMENPRLENQASSGQQHIRIGRV
jgi:hypothetical protein